jgi:hypothetical protein
MARRWFSFETDILRPTKPAKSDTRDVASVAIRIISDASELESSSLDGKSTQPAHSPANAPTTVASTSGRHCRLDKMVDSPAINATSTRKIHGGKSRLSTIITGHQQSPDPISVRISKSL